MHRNGITSSNTIARSSLAYGTQPQISEETSVAKQLSIEQQQARPPIQRETTTEAKKQPATITKAKKQPATTFVTKKQPTTKAGATTKAEITPDELKKSSNWPELVTLTIHQEGRKSETLGDQAKAKYNIDIYCENNRYKPCNDKGERPNDMDQINKPGEDCFFASTLTALINLYGQEKGKAEGEDGQVPKNLHKLHTQISLLRNDPGISTVKIYYDVNDINIGLTEEEKRKLNKFKSDIEEDKSWNHVNGDLVPKTLVMSSYWPKQVKINVYREGDNPERPTICGNKEAPYSINLYLQRDHYVPCKQGGKKIEEMIIDGDGNCFFNSVFTALKMEGVNNPLLQEQTKMLYSNSVIQGRINNQFQNPNIDKNEQAKRSIRYLRLLTANSFFEMKNIDKAKNACCFMDPVI